MTTHHAPDTGFKLFALVKDVLAQSGETDTDQLALEVLERIPAYDRETALFQALRQLVRTSFRPAFIPAIPKQATTGEPPRTSDNPPPERDGRQWVTTWGELRDRRPPDESAVAESRAALDEDDVLARAPEFVAGREDADRRIAAGEVGDPLPDVMAELDAEYEQTAHSGPVTTRRPHRPAPPPPPRPKTSPKVAAIREAWRKSLMQRIAVGDGKHKFLGDCTADDLQFAAKQREEHALRTQNRAAELRRLVDLMREHGATHLSDLPAEVLAEAPLENAA